MKRLVCRSGGWEDGVEGLEKGSAVGLALLPLDNPSLVPSHVGGWLQHVVTVPSGDGDEGNSGGVVANLGESNAFNMEIDSLAYEIKL